MAVFDWPEALIPQRCIIGSQSAGEDFKSPYNGTLQQVDFVAERFTLNATLPQRRRANAGAVEAFLFRLRGGGNRVRAWHFSRPVPAGTLRGAPTLKTTVTRGASSVVLQACTGDNLLLHGGFELDAGVDGLSDGIFPYTVGVTGTITHSRPAHVGSAQRITAAGLGTTTGDVAGYGFNVFVPCVGGQTYTLAADLLSYLPNQVVFYIDFFDSGLSIVTSMSQSQLGPTSGWTRRTFTFTAPAGATSLRPYLWMNGSGMGSPGLTELNIDNVAISAGASASYSTATVKAGDMLGLGGQLLMAAEDATANDAGEMTVPLIHRVRGTITAGSAVTWNKPTAEFTMPSRFASVSHFPGGIEGAGLDLEEYWAP